MPAATAALLDDAAVDIDRWIGEEVEQASLGIASEVDAGDASPSCCAARATARAMRTLTSMMPLTPPRPPVEQTFFFFWLCSGH